MAKKELRVLSVEFKHVLGIEEKVIDPQGRGVLAVGPNGSGKSSLLRGTQAALTGGSLATLKNIHAPEEEEPEVVVVLGGPGGHYRIQKEGDKTARVLRRVGDSAAFEDVPRPQQFLSGLFDTRGANPVQMLTAKEKDLALMILEALPLVMDEAQLGRILADVQSYVRTLPLGLHPLEHLALVRDMLFTARTGVNRDAKGKTQAAEQTRREAPAAIPDDPSVTLERLEGEARTLAAEIARQEEAAKAAYEAAGQKAQAAHDAGEQTISGEFKVWAAKRRGAHEQKAAEIRAEAERLIAAQAAEVETEVDARRTQDEHALGGLDEDEAKTLSVAEQNREAALAEVQGNRQLYQLALSGLATMRERADASKKAVALHALAKQFDDEAATHQAESERLTQALNGLDAFRRSLADSLPISGLEIEGQEIRRDGVPWSQLNHAQRVEIVATIAALRAEENPLRLMFLDGLEGLDTEHRTALIDELLRRGVQPFGAVVTDGAADVHYIGAVHAEPELVAAAPAAPVPAPRSRGRRPALME